MKKIPISQPFNNLQTGDIIFHKTYHYHGWLITDIHGPNSFTTMGIYDNKGKFDKCKFKKATNSNTIKLIVEIKNSTYENKVLDHIYRLDGVKERKDISRIMNITLP